VGVCWGVLSVPCFCFFGVCGCWFFFFFCGGGCFFFLFWFFFFFVLGGCGFLGLVVVLGCVFFFFWFFFLLVVFGLVVVVCCFFASAHALSLNIYLSSSVLLILDSGHSEKPTLHLSRPLPSQPSGRLHSTGLERPLWPMTRALPTTFPPLPPYNPHAPFFTDTQILRPPPSFPHPPLSPPFAEY